MVAFSASLAARKASASGVIASFGMRFARKSRTSLGGDDAGAAIGFIPAADDHSAGLQPVDDSRDSAVRQADLRTQLFQAQALRQDQDT